MSSLFARREFLIGGAAASALAVPSITNSPKSAKGIDPRSFGARGDGTSDDSTAVRKALSSAFSRGLPVDGGNAQFAVRGDISVTGARSPWIKSLRLRQLSPADDRKTLHFQRCEQIRIDRLQIDVGGAKSIGYFNASGGLWIDGGSNHIVRNVEVFGDGKNSLIAIWNTSSSKYADLHGHNGRYDARSATDDVLQAIFLYRNRDCLVQSPVVSNLSGNASSRFPTRYTRGITAGGNFQLIIIDAKVSNVDQGIDLTGSDGNRRCSVLRSHCFQCNAVGIKLANSAVDCRVSDCVADRCGLVGFLASGPSEAGLPYKTQNCDFVRCTAYDPGYNGFSDSAPHAGFRVERSHFDPEYPMGVRFINCRAIDRQAHRTMDYGFYEHVQPGAKAAWPNELIDCSSVGYVKAMQAGHWN